MKRPLAIMFLFGVAAQLFCKQDSLALGADKPTIYNHITGEVSELDRRIEAALGKTFTVIEIPDSPGYVQAKPANGDLPRVAHDPSGAAIGGRVFVVYVITEKGDVVSPVVLETTDERLNATATKAMEGWRFAPATLEGKAIAIAAGQEFFFETTPTEFVEQILEPTGGKIFRPKDWFYAEGAGAHRYDWILSREDTEDGAKPYVTGVRIQLFAGIEEKTGKTPREFILDFVEAKKKEAAKVVHTCEPEDQGLFTRVCLETEEGPFHILYSCFWGNEADLAVVAISGTTRELWEIYAPAFDRMSAFEIIDMKRFEKDGNEDPPGGG